MPFVDVQDARIFFTDEGSGDPPLLFVHGYSCDSHDWSWQLAHFAPRHRIIAYDNRGHGRSSVPEGGYERFTFAADAASLIEQLGCGPVVAIGHSLGGAIVSTLAVERPDLVRAVVSIDPGYLIPDEARESLDQLVGALQTYDPVSVAQGMLSPTYVATSPPALKTWHMRRIAGGQEHVLRQTVTNLLQDFALTSDSAPYLARRTCPVLTMYVDPARAATEEALFTDDRSRVAVFEETGHWIHQEQPDEVNAMIEGWLASL
jgi:pimeloyl-ACP methyl ester carboxylesterase